jgi:hypothetical protein
MNRLAGTEKPCSWKATNDTTNHLGARHGLVARNLPLDCGGERGKLACLDETEELLAGNVGACPVQHRGDRVSECLGAQEAVALRMRKSSESRTQVQDEEDDGKVKSWTCARLTVLKGPPRQWNVRPRARASRRNKHPLTRRLDPRGTQTCNVCAWT